MNRNSQSNIPQSEKVEQRRPGRLNLPDGPNDTAEPDGQFPDNNPDVGTIHVPGEDPVRDKDAEGASLAEDPDGLEKVAGLRREAEKELHRP
jgi:hypothetical protein